MKREQLPDNKDDSLENNGQGALNKKKLRNVPDISLAERFDVPFNQGLTALQVEQRTEEGYVNVDTTKKGKSIARIVLGNIFTFFNIIYILIASVLIAYGQFSNSMFILIIVVNTAIAIIQEIKAKKTLDKLNLVTVPHVTVVRDGERREIGVDELVLDDIIIVENGAQISADSIVAEGMVEVNESILTGESEGVTKRPGDTLFAGSFVVSGKCSAKVDKVGKFNYIASLTGQARKYRKPNSQILRALKSVLVFVAIIIIPTAVCLWTINYKAFTANPPSGQDVFIATLNKTAGSIISMIPAGPFLLTSVALAVSFVKLARRKTMVQELYCIEMLARVDCLCLDKTGTITDGTMRVVETVDLRTGNNSLTLKEIMGSMNSALKEGNMTGKALKKYFGSPRNPVLESVMTLPFNSTRKMSAVAFKGNGTYFLGAPEFVLRNSNSRVNDLVAKYAEQGLRVLLLAHSSTGVSEDGKLPSVRRPIAVIVIEDTIRSDAEQTIKWFKGNNVEVKVISGDNPMTVSFIAGRVGVPNANRYISLEGMSDKEVLECACEYTVFGRVSPDQKALLVKALKNCGKTVAMTGDGVNDILAMKQSDCSISLAGGSDAARNVAHLILMNDSFSALKDVVAEGRRVVNNIQSATSMYFMKTIYIIFINLMLIVCNLAFNLVMTTPFESIQIMLLETVIVGIPTTLLALQPNHEIIKGNFLANVMRRAAPSALTFIIGTVSLYVMRETLMPDMSLTVLSTLIALTYTAGGLSSLFQACKPFNLWRGVMFAIVAVVVVFAIVLFPDFWHYDTDLSLAEWLLLALELVAIWPLTTISYRLFAIRLPRDKKRRSARNA